MTLQDSYPIYVANRPEQPNTDLAVTDKYSGETDTRTALADPVTIDRAIATAAGAELLCGGTREAALLEATILKNVSRDQKLCTEEAFGPVVILDTFTDFDDALRLTNDSAFGIHAGVFTQSLDHALRALDTLEVGGVLINEIPSWRVDNMPYGGVKDSGLGREGVRYAMDDMTEIRTLIIREPSRQKP